jgi:hypothetical protein
MLTTALSILFFYKASNYSKPFLIIIFFWLAAISVLSVNRFFTVTDGFPPRFALVIGLPSLIIAALFVTSGGKKFISVLDQKNLILLHSVRVPVELILYWLFLNKAVPQLMTFEAGNLDIISGVTAPIVYYFYLNKKIGNKLLLLWNILCLLLLFNIVARAILSAPSPFQKLAFDQPNIAVLYFPFVFLPACIVPLVLFSHLAMISKIVSARHAVMQADLE